VEILTFELAGQRYALFLRAVREVVRAVSITRLPGAPAVVEGIVRVRGELVPVMDVRKRLELPAKPLDPGEYLVLAEAAGRTVAMRVEATGEILELEPSELRSARDLAPRAEYLAGVVGLPDGLVLIHDLERFLSPAESISLDDALRARMARTTDE
jgi:purine-binding chemotaxis protein CheW